MLSIKIKRNCRSVVSYFKEHLETEEYYSEKGHHDGKWWGKGLEYFGVVPGSLVRTAEFNAFARGVDPKTKKNLTLRVKENRRICYDMTFSPPKSLSIMALVGKDQRLVDAHHEAVALAYSELEKKAQTRVRKALSRNKSISRFTGNLVSAHFTHTTSRAIDPQLHSHCVVFNVTYDPVEKRTKALETGAIHENAKYFTAVYRNELASRVRALGYELEEGKQAWRLKSLPKEIEVVFSKRANVIQTLVLEHRARGEKIDNNRISDIAGKTRSEKDQFFSEEKLLELHQSQLSGHQIRMINLVKENALQRSLNQKPLPRDRLKPLKAEVKKGSLESRAHSEQRVPEERDASKSSIRYALEHVFERKSVVQKEVLLEAALKHSCGRASFLDLCKELESDEFLIRGDSIMTRDERKREVAILSAIREGRHGESRFGQSDQLTPSTDKKFAEQYKAAKTILDSTSQFLYLRGKAGVGKTHTLKEIVHLCSLPVIVSAPTSSATDTLRTEISEKAQTVQKFLSNEIDQKKLKNSAWVIDEAGLLSTKQMEQILSLAKEHKTKVLFVGDTRQHNSVEGGDALRLIEDYSVIPIAEISTITRQKEAQYLNAVQALSAGKIEKGFEILDEMNAIQTSGQDSEERAKRVAQEYVEKTQEGLSTLVITPTWEEHARVTRAIREALKAENTLPKKEVVLTVYQPLNFTKVEKTHIPNFERGQYLSFHFNIQKKEQDHHFSFKQGEVWEVVAHSETQLQIKNRDQDELRWIMPKSYAKAFDVVKAEVQAFAQGDLILMKANYASSPVNKISNGSIKKIEKMSPDGTIHLEGGIKLDPNFRHFVHGYATTSQGSQGKTRDHVIVSMDSTSPMALSKNQFYVSTSRGIRGVSIFTDNRQKLKEAVIKSSARKLVLDRLALEGIFKAKLEKIKLRLEKDVDRAQEIAKNLTRDGLEKAFQKFGKAPSRDSAILEQEERSRKNRLNTPLRKDRER